MLRETQTRACLNDTTSSSRDDKEIGYHLNKKGKKNSGKGHMLQIQPDRSLEELIVFPRRRDKELITFSYRKHTLLLVLPSHGK